MSGARPWLRSLRRRAATSGSGDGDHAALAGGQLLVRVEGEGREIAARADQPALGVVRPERLAGVLEQAEAARRRRALAARARGRVAEDVDRQQARGALADAPPRPRRVEVERDRVDVAEDRRRALVEQAVGRGDEAERRGDDLVARRPSRAPARRGAGPPCPRRPRPRRRRRASRRSRARSAPASARARAGPSAAPRAPAPPRARRATGFASGIFSQCVMLDRRRRPRALAGTRTRASRRAPPRRPR